MLKILQNMLQKRGDIVNDSSKCVYCGMCAKCHHKAITVDAKNKTWKLDTEKCVRCKNCLKCSKNALSIVKK